MTTPDNPPLDELADDRDQLGWVRERHGTFAEHAAPDDAVPTVDADAYLGQLAEPEGGGA